MCPLFRHIGLSIPQGWAIRSVAGSSKAWLEVPATESALRLAASLRPTRSSILVARATPMRGRNFSRATNVASVPPRASSSSGSTGFYQVLQGSTGFVRSPCSRNRRSLDEPRRTNPVEPRRPPQNLVEPVLLGLSATTEHGFHVWRVKLTWRRGSTLARFAIFPVNRFREARNAPCTVPPGGR